LEELSSEEEEGLEKGASNRSFCSNWLDYFPWLLFDKEHSLMRCSICIKHVKKGKYTKGVKRFRIDGLKRHAQSKKHMAGLKSEVLSNTNKLNFDPLWFSFYSDMVKLVQTAKFCLDHNFSITTFKSLCSFLRELGIKFKTTIYQSEYGFLEILNSMSSILKEDTIRKVKKSKFFSLMVDESTDIADTKELAIIVKYFDHDEYLVKTSFLGLHRLDSSDSKTIKRNILLLIEALGLCITNMVGISTDGASVMVGALNGVCNRLAKYAPYLIQTHCIAHRLNLAFKDSEKTFTQMESLNQLVSSIYNYFRSSPTKIKSLEVFAAMRRRKAYKVLRVYDIRWLSKSNVFTNLTKNYLNILDVLRERIGDSNKNKDDRVKAKELYSSLKTIKNLYLIFGIQEILSTWALLIKRFQKDNVDASLIMKDIENFQATLRGKYLSKQVDTPEMLKDLFKANNHGVCDDESFIEHYSCLMREISESLITNIKERFPQTKLLLSTRILCIDEILNETDHEKLVNISVDELKIILDHIALPKEFKTLKGKRDSTLEIVDRYNVLREFSLFKFMLHYNHQDDLEFRELSTEMKWSRVFKLYENLYGSLFKVIRIWLILPFSTVPCERLFSKKNLIKTRIRSRLRTKTLDTLLRCSLASSDTINTLQRDIVDHFLKAKDRFILKYSKKAQKSKPNISQHIHTCSHNNSLL
jgi:hypothetical protein